MKRNLLILTAILIGFTIAGCKPKQIVKDDMAGIASDARKGAEVVPDDSKVSEDVKSEDLGSSGDKAGGKYVSLAPGDGLTKEAEESGKLYTVHFEYDRYNVRDEDKPLLGKNAKWLGINPNVRIKIEGHADERGETEYNLALGDKRAKSVEKYLNDLGIPNDRISTVSYGEEKPADPGHGEDAWSKNRRAEFKILN